MKLRNKKTGEIMPLCGNSILGQYDTLAEFNAEWEDYEPKEPLIKDEKIRKTVRAWAKANCLSEVLYDKDKDCIYSPYTSDETDTSVSISFDNCEVFKGLEHRQLYKIAELCGEEEE